MKESLARRVFVSSTILFLFSSIEVIELSAILFPATSVIQSLLFKISGRSKGTYIVVCTPNGESRYMLSVDNTVHIHANQIALTLTIENGSARTSKANCHDQVCVHTGSICKQGESIVCLPAQVQIYIYGGETEHALDQIAG